MQQSQVAKGLPPEGTGLHKSGEAVTRKAVIHSGLGVMEFFHSLLGFVPEFFPRILAIDFFL